jgi:heptosyltransferase I
VRLLIVKTSSMGDVVHAMPAVTDLLRHRPDAHIEWLVEARFADIVAMHPGIQHVHPMAWRQWRKRLWSKDSWAAMAALRRALSAQPFDLVLDLQGLLKSALWSHQAIGTVAGPNWASAREPLASLLYARRAPAPRGEHAVQRSRLLMAAHLHYPLPQTPADFGLQAPDAAWLPSGRFAVLIPNASRPEKFWPNADWIAIGVRLQVQGWRPVVLWGSPQEQQMAQAIAAGCGGLVPPFLKVGDVAGLLARCEIAVGLDTGFSHLAAAFGRPVVGIYCDHEPSDAGITGSGGVNSIGGIGQRPSLAAVLALVEQRISAKLQGTAA